LGAGDFQHLPSKKNRSSLACSAQLSAHAIGLPLNLHFGSKSLSMKNTGISKDGEPPKVLTVEQTRESLKLQKAMSLFLLVSGCIFAIAAKDSGTATALYSGVFLCLVGGIWLAVTRIRIGWIAAKDPGTSTAFASVKFLCLIGGILLAATKIIIWWLHQ
jgi:hypothetical protein